MTSQYSHTHGVKTLKGELDPARQQKQAGYQTAMIGKWHLGAEPAFDYYCVLPRSGIVFRPRAA